MHGHKTSHLPIRYFLALLWAHPILHISTIRVKDQTEVTQIIHSYVRASLLVYSQSTTNKMQRFTIYLFL